MQSPSDPENQAQAPQPPQLEDVRYTGLGISPEAPAGFSHQGMHEYTLGQQIKQRFKSGPPGGSVVKDPAAGDEAPSRSRKTLCCGAAHP